MNDNQLNGTVVVHGDSEHAPANQGVGNDPRPEGPSTGNALADAIRSLPLQGNVIPDTWYRHPHLKTKSGEVNSSAVLILSEIVDSYRRRAILDEDHPKVIRCRTLRRQLDALDAKAYEDALACEDAEEGETFHAYEDYLASGACKETKPFRQDDAEDYLDIRYQALTEKFGFSVSTIKRCISFLSRSHVISTLDWWGYDSRSRFRHRGVSPEYPIGDDSGLWVRPNYRAIRHLCAAKSSTAADPDQEPDSDTELEEA